LLGEATPRKLRKYFIPLGKKQFECFSREIISKASVSTHPLHQSENPGNEVFYSTDTMKE
jgi:hypothetical protein